MSKFCKVDCPYCGEDVDLDVYELYEEEGPEEVYCDACEKTFHAWVCYIPHYRAKAVDCLNGAPHSFEPCHGYQVTHNVEKECSMCGERQYGTWSI